jgi:hypothetical protein
MRSPSLFVCSLTAEEHQEVVARLRSPNAFVVRRCQIVLASANDAGVPWIAAQVGCSEQTVRNVLHAFNTQGVACPAAHLRAAPYHARAL